MTIPHTVYDAHSKLSLVLCATQIVQRKLTSELGRPNVSRKRLRIYVPQVPDLSTSPYVDTVTIFGPLYLTFLAASSLTANILSRRSYSSDARSFLRTLLDIVPTLRIWSCVPCHLSMSEILSPFSRKHHPHCNLSFLILYLSPGEYLKESHTPPSPTFLS